MRLPSKALEVLTDMAKIDVHHHILPPSFVEGESNSSHVQNYILLT